MITYFFLQVPTINVQDFFTPGSFATLLGCTAVVYIVCGVTQSVFNFSPKWFALLVALAVSVFAMLISPLATSNFQDYSPATKYVIAVLNGLLIYSSASGSNQLLNQRTDPVRKPPAADPASPAFKVISKRKFRTDWFAK